VEKAVKIFIELDGFYSK